MDHALQFTRYTRFSRDHRQNLCQIQFSAVQLEHFSGIDITDSMAERCKGSVRFHESQCSDSLHIVADPGPEAAGAVLAFLRCHLHLDRFPVPKQGKTHRGTV